MSKRKPFDKYETTLLLYYCLLYLDGAMTKTQAIEICSSKLRNIEINKGTEIEKSYRDIYGIAYQMRLMEAAFTDVSISRVPPMIFKDTISVYKEDNKRFTELLMEAKQMAVNPAIKKDIYYKEKYPLIYKKLHDLMVSCGTKKGKKLEEIFIDLNKIARYETIREILNGVSWCKNYNGEYYFNVTELEEKDSSSINYAKVSNKNEFVSQMLKLQKQKNSLDNNSNGVSYVDFNLNEKLAYSIPMYVKYCDENKVAVSSWKEIYVYTIKQLYKEYKQLIPQGKSFSSANGRIDLGTKNNLLNMRSPRKIDDNTYLETNLSAEDIIRKIKILLDICSVDYKDIIIAYKKKGMIEEQKKETLSNNYNKNEFEQKCTTKDDENEKIPSERMNFTPYIDILNSKFKKGFKKTSSLEIRKFRKYWEMFYKETNKLDDDEIIKVISKCGITCEDKVYLPDKMLSSDVKDELIKEIDVNFERGHNVIYYKALFNRFSEVLLDSNIYTPDMLRAYLEYIDDGKWYVNKEYISKDKDACIDPYDEVKTCLLDKLGPMSYKEIFKALVHLPEAKIKRVLSDNDEFVSNGRNVYFHIDVVNLSEEDIEDICGIIEESINEKLFISGNELIEAIKNKYPHIIEGNNNISDKGLRDALALKIGDRFSFKGNVISSLDKSLSMVDVFKEFCKSKESFTLDELKVLKNELDTIIYFDVIYANSLRISKDEFVSKKYAAFNIAETDKILDDFCVRNYIPISQVQHFGTFPEAGFKWNSYLLEQYVYSYSNKYKLLHTRFNESSCVGAIVKKSSNISDFNELLINVLAECGIELNRDSALQYLCDEEYIGSRSYSEIDQILIKAKELRNQKGI